eukprot:1970714-Pyramimonas_sp.AAC.1
MLRMWPAGGAMQGAAGIDGRTPDYDKGKQKAKGGANGIAMYGGWGNISTPPPGGPAPWTAGPSASQVGAGVR